MTTPLSRNGGDELIQAKNYLLYCLTCKKRYEAQGCSPNLACPTCHQKEAVIINVYNHEPEKSQDIPTEANNRED